jgi:hypothetical protein
VNIRRATPEDTPEILGMLHNFYLVSGIPDAIKFDPDYLGRLIAAMCEPPNILLVAGDPLFGTIGGLMANHPLYPQTKIATELWWWVEPSHRRRHAGTLLRKGYEVEAKAHGGHLSNLSLLRSSPNLVKELTFDGYYPAEQSFLKEL